MNAWDITSAYWLMQFREALSRKDWSDAELYYHRHQWMKRRANLAQVLGEICGNANFAEDTNGR